MELLEYWLEYPPVHVLFRGFVGYKSKGRHSDSWREKRAEEMGDHTYRPPSDVPAQSEKDFRIEREFINNPKHLDCAPPHIQQAVERSKKGEHLLIGRPD